MNADRLITVIVPVYNTERYLRPCLDSILAQTRSRLEILLIDDGSTDRSGAVCDEYAAADKRIRVFHTENRGLSAARNLGLEHTSGDYICFVDSDDRLEEDACRILALAAERTGADLTEAGFYKDYLKRSLKRARTEEQIYRGEEILGAFADGRFTNFMWGKLYSRSLIGLLRCPEGRIYEDVFVMNDLLPALGERGSTAVVLPDALYHYRERKSGLSKTKNARMLADHWTASRARFDALSGDRGKAFQSCIAVCCKMWLSFSGFSKEEKAAARPVVREMKAFAKEQRGRAGRIGPICKAERLAVSCDASLWVRVCYAAGRLRAFLRGKKYGYYD